jgi:hypothetical protein
VKIGNHFRRAAGKIDSRNISLGKPVDDAINRVTRHDLLALRPCIHMTMYAGEVAELADVQLENFRACPAQLQTFSSESTEEPVHLAVND